MNTDTNNEVIDLSPPVEWLYKCDCPQCRVGAHYNKDIAESYRKRGELTKEFGEIRAALGDDGRRTHKEILELASKASHWREWKQKYIDLKNAHIAEGQDPAGTIWEHADKLQGNLKSSQSEIARLRKILEDATDLIAGIMWDEVNAIDECEKWLRAYAPDRLNRLAPSPDETLDGVTMDEWYGGFSKIESTEHVDEVSKLKEMVMDAARRGDMMAAHWKERAEHAEALIQQLHHLAELLPEASKA